MKKATFTIGTTNPAIARNFKVKITSTHEVLETSALGVLDTIERLLECSYTGMEFGYLLRHINEESKVNAIYFGQQSDWHVLQQITTNCAKVHHVSRYLGIGMTQFGEEIVYTLHLGYEATILDSPILLLEKLREEFAKGEASVNRAAMRNEYAGTSTSITSNALDAAKREQLDWASELCKALVVSCDKLKSELEYEHDMDNPPSGS